MNYKIVYVLFIIFVSIIVSSAWTYTVPPNSVIDSDGIRFGNTSQDSHNYTSDNFNVLNFFGTIVGSYIDSYTCDAAYCVYMPWYSSGYVYAKNTSTGRVEYSDTDASIVFQALIDNDATPISVKNGVYLFNTPVSKTTLNDVIEIYSTNFYWSVPSIATGKNSAIFRANTQMDTLFTFLGRGSLSGIVFDGNNKVNNVLSFEQTGTAVPRFAEIRNVKVMRSLNVALNLNNSEAINFYSSVFSDSVYGWKSTISPSGAIYCYNCYWQNNSETAIYLNGSASDGGDLYLYGGVIANDASQPNYNSSIILLGNAYLEAFGLWVDASNGSNIRGVARESSPSVTLYGGRYAVASTASKNNFMGNFSRFEAYGRTDLINAGTATTILNIYATSVSIDGYASDGTSIGSTAGSMTRWYLKDNTLASVISNIPMYGTQKPSSPSTGVQFYDTTGKTLQYYNSSAWNSVLFNTSILVGNGLTLTRNPNGTVSINTV